MNINRNAITGVMVGAGLVALAVILVSHVIPYELLGIFGAVTGVAHLLVAIVGGAGAVAADVVAERGTQQATGDGANIFVAFAVPQLMAYSCTKQAAHNRTGIGVASAGLAVSNRFIMTGLLGNLGSDPLINRAGINHPGVLAMTGVVLVVMLAICPSAIGQQEAQGDAGDGADQKRLFHGRSPLLNLGCKGLFAHPCQQSSANKLNGN